MRGSAEMRRLMALVVGAAMIAGALVVRDRLDRRETTRETVVRLACVTELQAACGAIEADEGTRVETTVEPAAATADRLTSEERPALDGWLTTPPWPEIVAAERRAGGLAPIVGEIGPPLARSPLVLVAWPDRARVLEGPCGGPLGWRCLGDAAANPGGWAALGGRPEWGQVKPAHPDPDREALGLLLVGQATEAFFGRADLARIDLDADDYSAWLTGLERAVRRTGGDLAAMLTRGPAAVDVVGTTEAEAGPLLARTARPDKPLLLYPAPMATADVLLVPVGDDERADVVRDVAGGATAERALADAGWRVEGHERAEGVPPTPALPALGALPEGTLVAVREKLEEVR